MAYKNIVTTTGLTVVVTGTTPLWQTMFDKLQKSPIASKLWAFTIQHRKGGDSFGKIERDFINNKSYPVEQHWERYPRKLYRYARGATISISRNKSMIDAVENELPGTRRILEHPLWPVINNPSAGLDELMSYIDRLDLDIVRRLVKTDKITGEKIRKNIKSTDQLYRISLHGNLDALTALLIIIREAEIENRLEIYIRSKWVATQLYLRLLTFYPLRKVAAELYAAIYDGYIGKNSPLPESMSDFLTQLYPQAYEAPGRIVNTEQEARGNELLIKTAHECGIISDSHSDQIQFLFWILHFFKRTEVWRELAELSNVPGQNKQLPPLLTKLVEMMNGDSRKFISVRSF